MAIIRTGRSADYVFTVDGFPAEKLRVAAFDGEEGISRLFRFQLDLASEDGAIDLDAMIGKKGLLTIAGDDGERYVHGVICRFEQVTKGLTLSSYEAILVPQIWQLSLIRKSKVFQNQTTKEIVEAVLKADGIAADMISFALRASYEKREYCIQYRESDLDFVMRLLEEDGISFFFVHSKTGHVLKLVDGPDTTPIAKPEILYKPATGGLEPGKEQVTDFRVSREARTGVSMLRDYDPLKSTVLPEKKEQADKETGYEAYDFPAGSEIQADVDRLAKVRLEEMRTTRAAARAESSVRRLVPGYRFTLTEHGRSEFNKEWLVTALRQSATQPQVFEKEAGGGGGQAPSYKNGFECILSDVPYRPPRLTPKPVVRGMLTAMVVGPSGEKLHMDEHGRARIQFHWDRDGQKDDKACCWVRVSQGYGGAGHGIQFMPLVGDEVLVDFLEGDPDRPLIVGRVYNSVNKPPLKPDDRIQNIILTPYKHRLMFDDKVTRISLNTGGKADQTIVEDVTKPDELPEWEQVVLEEGKPEEYGPNVRVSTQNKHVFRMAKGDKLKGAMIQTEAKHKLEMRDDPDPGIFIVDMDGKIYLHLDTKNKTINLINEQKGEINIKCPDGTINVVATDITVDAKNKVDIKGGAEISMKAPKIAVSGDATVDIKAGTGLTMDGGAQASLKGAMTKVEGSGMAELKGGGMTTISGGLVKIN